MSVLYNYVIADPNVEEELGPPPLPPKQPKDNKPAEDKPPPRPPHDVKKSAQPYSLTKLGSTSINSLPTPKPLPRPQSASSLLYNVNSPNVSFNGSGSNIEIAVRSIKYDTGGETSTSFFKVDNNDKLLTSSKVRLKPSSSTGSLLKTNETAVTLREQLNRDKNQIPTLGSSTELFSGQTDNSDSSKISFGHVNITSSRSPSPGRRSQSPRRQLSAGANKGKMGLSLFMNNLAHTASPKAQSNNGSIASGSRSNSQRNLNCIQTCVSVIGARKSGKTSLCRRFTQGTFEELYEPTFTFETYNRTITLGAGKAATSVDVKVLDTAVESVPLKESRPFLEMADGIMLVYSITSVESAQALEGLLDIIYAWSGIGDRSALPILVVATQSDGIAGKPFKHSETTRKALKIGQQFAELNELPHLETTALSPRATEVFSHLIRLTLTRR